MVDFGPELAEWAMNYAAENIPDEVLYLDPEDPTGYGRETHIHTTVCYGLDPKMDRQLVADIVAGLDKPVKVRLGKISKFEPEDYDVIKVDVESDDLHALHDVVKALGVPGETYPDYKPHLTLAYVKKGGADDLLGQTPFEGQEFELTGFDYSAPPEPGQKDKHTKYEVGTKVKAVSAFDGVRAWVSPDGVFHDIDTDELGHSSWVYENDAQLANLIPKMQATGDYEDLSDPDYGGQMVLDAYLDLGWVRVLQDTNLNLTVSDISRVEPALKALPQEWRFCSAVFVTVSQGGQSTQELSVDVDEGEDALDAWRKRNSIRKRVRATTEAPARPQTETPEFKAWFSGSKVVDGMGRPLMVFHGTAGDFNTFKTPSFFTADADAADSYARDERSGSNPNMKPVYLSIKNPARSADIQKAVKDLRLELREDLTWKSDYEFLTPAQFQYAPQVIQKLESEGFDGGIVDDFAMGGIEEITSYCAFRPNQIKSATGNRGAFDPEAEDITAGAEGPLPEGLRFYHGVNDTHGGELFCTSTASIGDQVVAALDWTEYQNEVRVNMIGVRPEFRRRGIATALWNDFEAHVKKDFPEATINRGLATDEGSKWLDSLNAGLTREQGKEAVGQAVGESIGIAMMENPKWVCPSTKMEDLMDRVMEKLDRWGAFEAYLNENFGIPLRTHKIFATTLEFTDRYQALGIPYPDPKTCCPGQCEGTGVIPVNFREPGPGECYFVYSDEKDALYRPLWEAAEAEAPSDDGYQFIKCPDCGGTGKVVASLKIRGEAMNITAFHGTKMDPGQGAFEEVGAPGEEYYVATEEGDAEWYATEWKSSSSGISAIIRGQLTLKNYFMIDPAAKEVFFSGQGMDLDDWLEEVFGPGDHGILENQKDIIDYIGQQEQGFDGVVFVGGFSELGSGDDICVFDPSSFKEEQVRLKDPDGEWTDYMSFAEATKLLKSGFPHEVAAALKVRADGYWVQPDGEVINTFENNETGEHGDALPDIFDGETTADRVQQAIESGWARVLVNDEEVNIDMKDPEEGVPRVLRVLDKMGELAGSQRMLLVDRADVQEIPIDEDETALQAWNRRHSIRKRVHAAKLSVPKGVAQNVKGFDGSLANVGSWKAKLVLGNNAREGQKKGEWDGVGYVMVNPDSGAIVPVAYGDEHQTGYDLLYHYQDKGFLNAKGFTPLTTRFNYLSMKDPKTLKVLKFWLDNGGPDGIVHDPDTRMQGRMSEWLAGGGQRQVEVGKLAAGGKAWIKALEQFSKLWAQLPDGREPDEQAVDKLFDAAFDVQTLAREWHFMWGSPGDALSKLFTARDVQGVGDLILGMAGTKNQVHSKLKQLIENPKSYEINDFKSFFGDLELAKAELDRLGSIQAAKAVDPVTETPEFKAWFQGSNVVDKTGAPQLVNHGTFVVGIEKFHGDTGDVVPGLMYFTDKVGVARSYGPVLYQCYLKMTNPLVEDMGGARFGDVLPSQYAVEAMDNGYDGVILTNIKDDVHGGKNGTNYMVWNPDQIWKVTEKQRGSTKGLRPAMTVEERQKLVKEHLDEQDQSEDTALREHDAWVNSPAADQWKKDRAAVAKAKKADKAKGINPKASLIAENKFDRLYKEAVDVSQNDAKYSGALENPALAQEMGQFQQAVKDSRSEVELQQAWERFQPSVAWEALVALAGQESPEPAMI